MPAVPTLDFMVEVLALAEAGKPALHGFDAGLGAGDKMIARARYDERVNCVRYLQRECFLDGQQELTTAGQQLLDARRGGRRA